MSYHIFVTKESRANERRVALTPEDTAQLIRQGHQVTVEHHAGIHAGFSNNAYQAAGAKIKVIETSHLSSYREAFKNINLIVRAKRPDHIREQLELQAIQPQTIMIGALDPLEKNTLHIKAYHAADINVS
ncbi:MAG: hypothetical protein CMF49_09985 [Legionellales bacterium]|nr:hypothetical protein [Legionellales bacterium]|tara:strand:- start:485 stop:874 length:390 start_codon:yes stop_codon:yes gene_type:complete